MDQDKTPKGPKSSQLDAGIAQESQNREFWAQIAPAGP